MKLIFCDTFTHPRERDNVDEIRFKVPVDVSGCRVIPASATPHTALLPSFKGQTKPATFTVEVFAKSLRFPSDRFQRLARPFTFSGDANAQLDVEPIITDHLVIRGHYSSLSLAVYGEAAEEFTVTLPEQAARADVAKKAATALKAADDAEVDLPQELRYPLPSVPVAPSTPSSLALTPPPQLLHSAAAAALEEAAETEASQDCSEVWQPVLAQLLKATSALSPLTCTMSASTLKRSKPPKPVAAADALSLSEETEAALVLRVLEWCCGALPNGKVMEAEVAMAEAAPMVTEAVDAMDTAAADAPGAVVATTENEAPAEVNAKAEQSDKTEESKARTAQLQRLFCGLKVATALCSTTRGAARLATAGGLDVLMALMTPAAEMPRMVHLAVAQALHVLSASAAGCQLLLGWWRPPGTPGSADADADGEGSAIYKAMVRVLLRPCTYQLNFLLQEVLWRLRFYERATGCHAALEAAAGVDAAGGGTDESAQAAAVATDALTAVLAESGEGRGARYGWQTRSEDARGELPAHTGHLDVTAVRLLRQRRLVPTLAAAVAAPAVRAAPTTLGAIRRLLLLLLGAGEGLQLLGEDSASTTALALAIDAQPRHLGGEDLPPRAVQAARTADGVLADTVVGSNACAHRQLSVLLTETLAALEATEAALTAPPASDACMQALRRLLRMAHFEMGRQQVALVLTLPGVLQRLVHLLALSPAVATPPPGRTLGAMVEARSAHPRVPGMAAELLLTLLQDEQPACMACWVPQAGRILAALNEATVAEAATDTSDGAGAEAETGGVPQSLLDVLREWLLPADRLAERGPVSLVPACEAVLSTAEQQEKLGTADADELARGLVGLPPAGVATMVVSLRVLPLMQPHAYVRTMMFGQGALSVVTRLSRRCAAALVPTLSVRAAAAADSSSAAAAAAAATGQEGASAAPGAAVERGVFPADGPAAQLQVLKLLEATVEVASAVTLRLHALMPSYHNTPLCHALWNAYCALSMCPELALRRSASAAASGPAPAARTLRRRLGMLLALWVGTAWRPSLLSRLLRVDAPRTTLPMLLLLGDLLPPAWDPRGAVGNHASPARRAALSAAVLQHADVLDAALRRCALTSGTEVRRLLVRVVLRLAALAPSASTLGVSALVGAAAAELEVPAIKSESRTQRTEDVEDGEDEAMDEGEEQAPPPPLPLPPLSGADRVRILRLLEALAWNPLGKMALLEAKALSRLAAVLGEAGEGVASGEVSTAALRVMRVLCNPGAANWRLGSSLAMRGAWDAAPPAESAVAAAAVVRAIPTMDSESAAAATGLLQLLSQYPQGRLALCRAALLSAATTEEATQGTTERTVDDGAQPEMDAVAVRTAAEALAALLDDAAATTADGGGAATIVAGAMRQVAALGPPAPDSLVASPSLDERFVAAGVTVAVGGDAEDGSSAEAIGVTASASTQARGVGGAPVRVWLREDDTELVDVEGDVSGAPKPDASEVRPSNSAMEEEQSVEPDALLLRAWAVGEAGTSAAAAVAGGGGGGTAAARPVKRFKLDTSSMSPMSTSMSGTRRIFSSGLRTSQAGAAGANKSAATAPILVSVPYQPPRKPLSYSIMSPPKAKKPAPPKGAPAQQAPPPRVPPQASAHQPHPPAAPSPPARPFPSAPSGPPAAARPSAQPQPPAPPHDPTHSAAPPRAAPPSQHPPPPAAPRPLPAGPPPAYAAAGRGAPLAARPPPGIIATHPQGFGGGGGGGLGGSAPPPSHAPPPSQPPPPMPPMGAHDPRAAGRDPRAAVPWQGAVGPLPHGAPPPGMASGGGYDQYRAAPQQQQWGGQQLPQPHPPSYAQPPRVPHASQDMAMDDLPEANLGSGGGYGGPQHVDPRIAHADPRSAQRPPQQQQQLPPPASSDPRAARAGYGAAPPQAPPPAPGGGDAQAAMMAAMGSQEQMAALLRDPVRLRALLEKFPALAKALEARLGK